MDQHRKFNRLDEYHYVRIVPIMIIGTRLRRLREDKTLSQGDIEERTGLLRCYISRVENGHTVPSLETLERLASALEIPLYQLFYEGDEPPALPNLSKRQTTEELVMDEESEKEMRFFEKVRRLTSRIDEKDRRWFRFTYAPCWYSKRKTGEKRGA